MYQWRPRGESIFPDRAIAGRELAASLKDRPFSSPVVLGMTRGGVPVAYQVAVVLHAPMDILVVKKLRAPNNPELAIGAITSGGPGVLRDDIIRQLGVTDSYVERERQLRRGEAGNEEVLYRGNNEPIGLEGRDVIIVDDGIATGSSVESAVLSVRQQRSQRVTVATPVASGEACSALRAIADEVVCLTTPREFWAVGMFYQDFSQVADAEVVRLLDRNRAEYRAVQARMERGFKLRS